MTYLECKSWLKASPLQPLGSCTSRGRTASKAVTPLRNERRGRHVAFGVLSLKEVYQDMTQAELLERQEFAFEAAVRMRDRFLQQEVWERMGADVKKVIPLAYQDPLRQEFQQLLFTKIVPNCKKLGLLDAGDGWLRKKFGEIGVIQYEDWVDIEDEVDSFAITRELEAEAALAES